MCNIYLCVCYTIRRCDSPFRHVEKKGAGKTRSSTVIYDSLYLTAIFFLSMM